MTKRRDFIKTLGLSSAAIMGSSYVSRAKPNKATFKYCLNTSTIRGQNPGLVKYIEITAEAGYDGIELWVEDIKNYIEAHSASQLKKLIDDHGIQVENAIGFAPWMAADEEKSKAGFEQMEKEMEMLASIGCKRVAAPAIGNEGPIDLMRAGEQYKQLIELGRRKGVMPQLEFWGAFKPFHHLGQTMMVAAVANDPDAKILADVYHLFRGGSGYQGLKLLSGNAIDIFHMNDYVDHIPREKQEDKDRVYPGDGAAPISQILSDLHQMGGEKILSLELFNRSYWEKDPLEVAKTGLEKMKSLVSKIS
jgi:2-keto-myo-inositol isomerase